MKKVYLKVKYKFIITIVVSLLFTIVGVYISYPWYFDLSVYTGKFVAILIIGGVAIIPGFINVFLVINILFDKQKYDYNLQPNEDVTIIIASYNEGNKIYNTLKYINLQDYDGELTVFVVDNNSLDNTKEEVARARKDFNINIKYIFENNQGKHFALNNALKLVKSEYFITLDADTVLHKSAIRYLVARIMNYDDVVAVAGAVMAKNSRKNILTKMQEWDYFLSMSSVKKMQGLYQGTLVAQGAFSIYKTETVKEIGGWSDTIGEDIVLTWNFLKRNLKVYYEPLAMSFTDVPEKLSHFSKQRSRWARGMIEGFRTVKPWQQPNLYYKFLTMIDIAIIFMDFSYTFFFIPGFILFLLGYPIIVGLMIFLVFPFTLATFLILYFKQKITVFNKLNLRVRSNILGFVFFIMFYQVLMSPISLYGYCQECLKKKRVWK